MTVAEEGEEIGRHDSEFTRVYGYVRASRHQCTYCDDEDDNNTTWSYKEETSRVRYTNKGKC